MWSKSDFLKTAFNIGSLIKAIKTDAAAFIPPESEKKSTDKPNKKLKIKMDAGFFLTGNRKIHMIYIKGFKYPNKLILLNTKTWSKTNPIKRKLFEINKLFIVSFLF